MFPEVSSLPVELLPFYQKSRLVELVQRKNMKQFNRQKIEDIKLLVKIKSKNLHHGMKDHPSYQDPNAINEKKVKYWSTIVESPKIRN